MIKHNHNMILLTKSKFILVDTINSQFDLYNNNIFLLKQAQQKANTHFG